MRSDTLRAFKSPLFEPILGNDGETWLVSTLTIPQHPVCACGPNRDYAQAIALRLNAYARAAQPPRQPDGEGQ